MNDNCFAFLVAVDVLMSLSDELHSGWSDETQGRMAEWSKALVLGTSHFGGAGSNPVPVKWKLLKYHELLKGTEKCFLNSDIR